jgi:hypothetical protein
MRGGQGEGTAQHAKRSEGVGVLHFEYECECERMLLKKRMS